MKGGEQWLEAGLDLLVESGPNGLTIERLCQAVGKTRGSFYHHFTNQESFVGHLLEYWERKHTAELIARTSKISNAGGGLEELHRLARHLPIQREMAIREWAIRSDAAAALVARVDGARVRHLQGFYASAGRTEELAETQAWLAYSLFLGTSMLGDTLPRQQRERMRDMIAKGTNNHDGLE